MATNAVLLIQIDGRRISTALQEARAKLEPGSGELVLDFSAVRRVDADALKSLQDLADAADQKETKVALRGVNVEMYKVLKLVKLDSRFAFVT